MLESSESTSALHSAVCREISSIDAIKANRTFAVILKPSVGVDNRKTGYRCPEYIEVIKISKRGKVIILHYLDSRNWGQELHEGERMTRQRQI